MTMNIIVICLDSFRQDHVGVYHQGAAPFPGVPACRTPNIDAFARDCVVFENVLPCGLPTIPIRTELMTGQFTLPHRPWQPLAPTDLAAADILRREGYICSLISDTYHFRAPGMNFHRGFHAYEWIRGQEYDPHVSSPPKRSVDDYVTPAYSKSWRRLVAQYLANTDSFEQEEDWFPAQVVDAACRWLEANRSHERIFCWIDSFDPHEPWDPPAALDTYRPSGYSGPRLILPIGGMAADWATPQQVDQVRGLYAGEAAFVDHRLGALFDCLDALGYYDDSVILLLADHGHPLADHGKFLKGPDRLHSELLKVPFLLRLPESLRSGSTPARSDAIVQFPDVLPTLLDLAGHANDAGAMAGRSFRPLLEGGAAEHRATAISGYYEGQDRCVRDRVWSYVERPEGQPDELYNLREDPRETRNLIDEHADVAVRLAGQYGSAWRRRLAHTVKGIQGQYEVASG